jgi:hypothetical protein
MDNGPTGRGTREENERGRVPERGGQGRWDHQHTGDKSRAKNGLAVCGARQGRVGRFLTPFRAPKTVEPEERFPERPGCSLSTTVFSLRAMCRILLERGRRGREAPNGPRDTRFEQVNEPVNFWRCSCLGGYSLRAWPSAWRTCTAGEARESLGTRLDAIGDRGRRFFGPAQYRVSSLYCEGNICRRDGRRLWGRGAWWVSAGRVALMEELTADFWGSRVVRRAC